MSNGTWNLPRPQSSDRWLHSCKTELTAMYALKSYPSRVLLSSIGAALLCSWVGSAFAKDTRPHLPNIVLIVAHDWAHMDLGVAGHPLLLTPNLDRLAREGVHFTQAFTPNPICMPSRAALLTGQDNWTNGCWFFGMPIKDTSRHFAQVLSEAGYET